MAVAPEALAILAPKEYLEALPALLPLVISTPFYFLSSISTAQIVYYGKTKYSLAISLTCAAACIILNYTLIGKWGYFGAGATYLLCQAISAVLGMILLSRTQAKIPICLKKALPSLAIALAVGILCYRLSDKLIWRAALLIIPCCMLLYCLIRIMPQITEKDGKKVP
jgi:O-antigen/teichoic acid export membrane protein